MSFQKATIDREVLISGNGLHTGQPVKICFKPADPDTGITFIRTDLPGCPDIQSSPDLYCSGAGRRSVIGNTAVQIDTTEHLFAALWGLGITDIRIEADGAELPALDGSSAEFYRVLSEGGIRLFDTPSRPVEISGPLFVSANKAAILALPSDSLKITYTLDYPHQQLRQTVFSSRIDRDFFIKEIASARTFCTKSEADALLAAGYGKGANTENTLVIDEAGPVDNRLKWADECARHKVLDLLGDISVLGSDIRVHFIAIRSGHDLNHQMVKKIAHQTRSLV
ncbi:MAG: UDP-3-O-[3-hydroxymyristoyl] N-acetylglucosamine deacetylase [Candidatus Omnitrophica bacterium]|nr:UDP-3-O-[3-hydroxymyristoyl] N-acetylglucosamine deacetylase [Candidatus Omnitrophota bacterium]